MSNLKANLKNVPTELFEKIETLLSEYGLDNAKVTGVDITSNSDVSIANVTEEDCAEEGKKLKCKYKPNGTLKCWCVNR
ncbi:hypothetical protein [Flavivirga rizhaonensis]|uniref:Uncharacterized protein n=1 Tax=Flavivirga rizhaonensis TaxID=2559571 RepID=A0A4S1DZD6_9FLAO|nr:hypothetical protein [Flavivirga rizhaonensis]TGV03385.1 hypothetical protein EM932_06850 [Flavivirga rizhaonensis]